MTVTKIISANGGGEPSVFDLNTQAVVILRAGHLDDAVQRFRDTLTRTRSLLQYEGPLEASQSDENERVTIPTPISLFTVPLSAERAPTQCAAADRHKPLPFDDGSAYCPIFYKAFVVCNDGETGEDHCLMKDERCQNVTLSAILYNLGLTHQINGMAKGKTSEFQIALNLYSMALTLLETRLNQDPSSQGDADCHNLSILLLAIINNTANIHSQTFNINETKSCMECLKGIVDAFNDSHHVLSAEDEEDHFFFYLNVFVTASLRNFSMAPAA